jgi:uncharacterized membrane protein YdcZ (DUF606 family)
MRGIYIFFEAALTVFWFWLAAGSLGLFLHRTPFTEQPDYGTAIGGVLFLLLGLLTLGMLINELFLFVRRRYNIELNPFRRLALAIAARRGDEDDDDSEPEQE